MVNVMEQYEARLRGIVGRNYSNQIPSQREQTSLAELSGLEGTIELAQKRLGGVTMSFDGTPMIPTDEGLKCAITELYKNCP